VALIDDIADRISDLDQCEIVFSGPQFANGYLKDEDKAEDSFQSFDRDIQGRIWYKTGRQGFLTATMIGNVLAE
jgi:hypothetical protein